MGGARVAGIIALVLAAAALVVGILNYVQHFIALRTRWFALIFIVLLVVAIILLAAGRAKGTTQPAK